MALAPLSGRVRRADLEPTSGVTTSGAAEAPPRATEASSAASPSAAMRRAVRADLSSAAPSPPSAEMRRWSGGEGDSRAAVASSAASLDAIPPVAGAVPAPSLTPHALWLLAERAASFVDGARAHGRRIDVGAACQVSPRVGSMHDGASSLVVMPRPGHPGSIIVDRELAPDVAEQVLAGELAYVTARLRAPEAVAQRARGVAALAVWIDQAFLSRGPSDPTWSARVRAQLPERLRAAGLETTPGGAASREAEERVLLARARLLAFVADPGYARVADGDAGGVCISGTDTAMGPERSPHARVTGHIMATCVAAAGAEPVHLSFGPVTNFAQTPAHIRARFAALSSVGIDPAAQPLGRGPDLGPYRGASAMLNTARVGMFYPHAGDPYRAQPLDFSFRLDPDWVDPSAFARDLAVALASEAQRPGVKQYVLATSVLERDLLDSPRVEVVDDRDPIARRARPRRLIVLQPDAHGREVVAASNCVTVLLDVLTGLCDRDGEPALDAFDLAVLGLSPTGHAVPGRDVRPQDLYDYLRFKQAERDAARAR